jgi:tectonin-like protein
LITTILRSLIAAVALFATAASAQGIFGSSAAKIQQPPTQSLGWKQLPGGGNDIGVGANGTAWLIGTNKVPGGYGIYRWDGANWAGMPGGAVRVDVDPKGNAWVVNDAGAIFRWTGSAWQQMPGAAKDIGIGADGSVWVIGTNPEAGGFGIYRWNPGKNNWDKIPGSAMRIAVDPKGNAWVVNNQSNIYVFAVMMFIQAPGNAIDIGIGANGAVFIVGTDHGVYQWTGNTWVKRDGTLDAISVDGKGNPWGVNSAKNVFVSGVAAPAPVAAPTKGEVTAKLIDLGIPNQKRYPGGDSLYARNPWVLKAFEGRVYVGSGNSNNAGPATNAGPVDVVYYDPAGGRFGSEWTVPDEQIDVFRIVNGSLTIPGHDPKESWAKGNFYIRLSGRWTEVRTIDFGIHMYDIIEKASANPGAKNPLGCVDCQAFSGKKYLYAAIGSPTGASIGVSSNNGNSWDQYRVFSFEGRARTFLNASDMCVSTSNGVYMVTPTGISDALRINLFPGLNVPGMFAAKAETFNGMSYYLGAYAPIDHNWKSPGAFATDCHSARRLNVTATAYHDILVDSGKLYLLVSDPEGKQHRNRVFVSTDGSNFKEVFNFVTNAFARSFAIQGGDFYFGLGCEAEAMNEDSGRIVRLKAADASP